MTFPGPKPDDLPRKAISIRQPWAWAIINAGKDIENRDWPTKFRGPVCIHAAKGVGTHADFDVAINTILNTADGNYSLAQLPMSPYTCKKGGIIGTAEIVDCVTDSDSPWFFGAYGFVLRNVRPVDFIPVKGALGFFNWRANL
jgi:hypothetical protein